MVGTHLKFATDYSEATTRRCNPCYARGSYQTNLLLHEHWCIFLIWGYGTVLPMNKEGVQRVQSVLILILVCECASVWMGRGWVGGLQVSLVSVFLHMNNNGYK